jgi:hypothetical protein
MLDGEGYLATHVKEEEAAVSIWPQGIGIQFRWAYENIPVGNFRRCLRFFNFEKEERGEVVLLFGSRSKEPGFRWNQFTPSRASDNLLLFHGGAPVPGKDTRS